MPPMKNVYNLITDAFSTLGHHEHNESDYKVDIVYTNTVIVSYEITIKSRDPVISERAFLHLILDSNNKLLGFDDTNNLFHDDNWERFCLVFEAQI